MKTILKLRKDEAAIVFRQDGIQLVQPETPQEMEVPEHVAFAATFAFAMQYPEFRVMAVDFLRRVTNFEQEVTH